MTADGVDEEPGPGAVEQPSVGDANQRIEGGGSTDTALAGHPRVGDANQRIEDGGVPSEGGTRREPSPRLAAPWVRRVALALTALFLVLWALEWGQVLLAWDDAKHLLAVDYDLYMDATRRWLAGGPFYEPYQLAGPYVVSAGDILYPPFVLVLFVPFTFLPPILWWAIPIAIVAAVLVRLHPAPLAWPVIALCCWWPDTNVKLLTGNPVIWVAAAVALGTLYAWPSVFALLKPSLFPFALLGIWRRSWWFGAAGLALVSLLFLPMWPDFLTAIANSSNPAGVAYSLGEVPTLLIPVAAALASTRGILVLPSQATSPRQTSGRFQTE